MTFQRLSVDEAADFPELVVECVGCGRLMRDLWWTSVQLCKRCTDGLGLQVEPERPPSDLVWCSLRCSFLALMLAWDAKGDKVPSWA